MTPARSIGAIALALAASAGSAAAYTEAARFAEPAIDGGGDGRYFTGSPADGLSCKVCHGDEPGPSVSVSGVPDRVVAGAAYQITLRWPGDERVHGAAIEVVDSDRRAAPTTLPALADQPAGMKCTGGATSAAELVTVGARQIVYVRPCGATEVTFGFTAQRADDLYLGAAVVSADGFETADGDGTYELRRTLAADDQQVTCSAGGGPGGGAIVLVAAALVVRRRRRSQ